MTKHWSEMDSSELHGHLDPTPTPSTHWERMFPLWPSRVTRHIFYAIIFVVSINCIAFQVYVDNRLNSLYPTPTETKKPTKRVNHKWYPSSHYVKGVDYEIPLS